MANENCLAGVRCPECGNTEHFEIVGSARFKVTDDGTEDYENVSWDERSNCYCPECGHSADMEKFQEKTQVEEPVLKKWSVQVTRTATRYVDIEVFAADRKNAEEAALEKAYDTEFGSEKEAEYEVVGTSYAG